MKRRYYLAAGAGAALGGFGLQRWQAARDAAQTLDDSFWSLSLRSAAGGELGMGQFRGRRLVLNFWATWCAPCVREMPVLDRFQRQFGAQGWQVLGLAIDSIAPVLIFSQKVPVSFPLLVAEAQGLQLSQRLGNPGGLPFTAAFDARGRLQRRQIGEVQFEQLSGWAASAALAG